MTYLSFSAEYLEEAHVQAQRFRSMIATATTPEQLARILPNAYAEAEKTIGGTGALQELRAAMRAIIKRQADKLTQSRYATAADRIFLHIAAHLRARGAERGYLILAYGAATFQNTRGGVNVNRALFKRILAPLFDEVSEGSTGEERERRG